MKCYYCEKCKTSLSTITQDEFSTYLKHCVCVELILLYETGTVYKVYNGYNVYAVFYMLFRRSHASKVHFYAINQIFFLILTISRNLTLDM